MVQLTRIYTGGGDKGETSLGDGSRVAKHDLRVAAYGTVDEANAVLGVVRAEARRELDSAVAAREALEPGGEALRTATEWIDRLTATDELLARIQNDLFDLGADLCTPEGTERGAGALRISPPQAERLEREIDTVNAPLAPLKSFILPGGTAVAAHLHHARTVARRAERLVTRLAERETVNPAAVVYLNRLSDLLFVLARHCNHGGVADVLWVPGANR